MSEMVERVAKAIERVNAETTGLMFRDLVKEMAIAAIKAMREPTEAMIEASNREWDGRMSHRSSGAWQAMIDAALPTPEKDKDDGR